MPMACTYVYDASRHTAFASSTGHSSCAREERGSSARPFASSGMVSSMVTLRQVPWPLCEAAGGASCVRVYKVCE
jgi:hypothetical protein